MNNDRIIWLSALIIQVIIAVLIQAQWKSRNPFLMALVSAFLGGVAMLVVSVLVAGHVGNIWPIACALYFVTGYPVAVLVGWAVVLVVRR